MTVLQKKKKVLKNSFLFEKQLLPLQKKKFKKLNISAKINGKIFNNFEKKFTKH